MAANAILVGAALVATVAFESWLQLLGGILAPDSASSSGSPSSSPSASSLSGSLQRNSMFYISLVLAFSVSMNALVMGTVATFSDTSASLKVEVQQLRRTVRLAGVSLVWAILALIMCFYFAGRLVFDKVATMNGWVHIEGFVIANLATLITFYQVAYYIYWKQFEMGEFHGNESRSFRYKLLFVGAIVYIIGPNLVEDVVDIVKLEKLWYAAY